MVLPSLAECAATLDRLAPVMLDMAVKSAMVFATAGLAALVMRGASAAARHWVWLLGFASAALLPVLSVTLPSWHILPRLTASRAAAQTPEYPPTVNATAIAAAPTGRLAAEIPTPARNGAPAPSAAQRESSVGSHVLTPALPHVGTAQIDLPDAHANAPAPTQTVALARRSWAIWLIPVWVAGTLLLLAHVSLGYLSLWMLRRRCTRIGQGYLPGLLDKLRRESGVRANVELLSSPMRAMPMTWGLWRPRLLLPEQALQWPPEQGRAVLLHELGHIQRWDCLTQLLTQVACALYWFNPLAWIAARRMQIERERACDDRVLNTGVEPSAYARHLLHSASALPVFRSARVAVAMARPSTMEERLRAILDTRRSRRPLTGRVGILTALVLLGALLPMAVLRAQEKPGDSQAADDQRRSLPTTRSAGAPFGLRPDAPMPRPPARGGVAAAFSRETPHKGEGPTCTLDATIYDVRLPAEQIGRLDVEALAKASTSADAFEKALAALGTFHPLYRASQSVRISGDTIVIGTQNPVVTNSSVGSNGQTQNSITYQATGAHFGLAGAADTNGGIDLDLNIQISAISEGGAAITEKVKAPLMRNATITHDGIVQPHKPFVVVSVDAASTDVGGKAVAYIGRIIVGDLRRPAPSE